MSLDAIESVVLHEARPLLESMLKRIIPTNDKITPKTVDAFRAVAICQARAEFALSTPEERAEYADAAKSYARAAAHNLDSTRLVAESAEHEAERQKFIESTLELTRALAPLILAAI